VGPSRSLLTLTAILLGPAVLLEFLHTVGANTNHPLYGVAVFTVVGLFAIHAARRTRVSYAMLLAGLSLLLAWLFAWEKILDHPSANTYRWLLIAAAVLLLAASVRLARAHAIGAGDLATAGAIAAIAAGTVGVVVGGFVGAFAGIATLTEESSSSSEVGEARSGSTLVHAVKGAESLPAGTLLTSASGVVRPRLHTSVSGSINSHANPLPRALRPAPALGPHDITRRVHRTPLAHASDLQHFGWDLYLLVMSVALLWGAARLGLRGLGYTGAVGLLAFLISAGAQITRVEFGKSPTYSFVGWPLALIIIGVVGLAAPVLLSRRDA
jgi:hypothetical protein